MPSVEPAVQLQDIERFIIHEARLLDEDRLDEWLSLFTDDACYWIPLLKDDVDPVREISMVYDDRKQLEQRIWRLQSGLAYGQDPKSRTRRVIGNIELRGEQDAKLIVSANFILAELRRGVQTIYAGRYEFHLRPENGSFRIALKKVELLNNDEPLGNISFIV